VAADHSRRSGSRDAVTIGPYRVGEELGRGGNAVVYRAVREGDAVEVALKVRAGTPSAEPYRRFKQEIETLQRIGSFPGVLPVLDSHVPNSPSKKNPAWLAMPIANRLRNALTGTRLEQVIKAVAGVADTLARLQEAHDLGHRDVKPPNLYELGGEWLIGDFGLIVIPDGEDLTATGKPVGSRHYTPWEMISNPAGAESHPADVYALGKTLWVLATDQNYPPEGPQPAGARGLSIGDYRPHPHDLSLDRLIERMTLRDPIARPTKREVAGELRAWLELPAPTPHRDVSEVRNKIRAKLATEISADEMMDRWRIAHREAWKSFEERYNATVNEMLRQVHPRPALDGHDDKLTMNTMRTTRTSRRNYLKQLYRCSSISTGHPAIRYALRAGRGIEVFDDGELKIHAFVDVGYPRTMGSDFYWKMDPISVAVESIEAQAAIEHAINQIQQKTAEALEIFAEKSPPAGGR
jgi:serine/threonine protein kinase